MNFILFMLLLFSFSLHPNDISFGEWSTFNKTKNFQIINAWMHCKLKEEFGGSECALPDISFPPFQGKFGVFVTLMKNKKVRGCYGAFSHQMDDFALVFTEYLRGALRNDPRYPPLDSSEINETKIIVTITQFPEPISDLSSINLSREGIVFNTEEGIQVVYVPGEIKSVETLKLIIKKFHYTPDSKFRAIRVTRN